MSTNVNTITDANQITNSTEEKIDVNRILFKISDYTVVYHTENDNLAYAYDDYVDELVRHEKSLDALVDDSRRDEFTRLYNIHKFPASIVRSVTRTMIDSDYVGYYSDSSDGKFSDDSGSDTDDSNKDDEEKGKLIADGFEILEFMNSKYIGRVYKSTEDWYKTEFLKENGRYFKQKKYKKLGHKETVYEFRMKGWDFVEHPRSSTPRSSTPRFPRNEGVWIFTD